MKKRRAKFLYKTRTPVLLAVIFAAAVGYVYFLNTAVVDVVAHKETSQKIRTLKHEIALLESEYIVAQHDIASRVADMHTVPSKQTKVFVSRTQSTGLVVNQ